MILVLGIPRTGSSAVMRLLYLLGYRANSDFNASVRGGYEEPRFFLLADRLRQYQWFPTCSWAREFAAGVAGEIESGHLSDKEFREQLTAIWEEHDAVKGPAAWGMLPVVCEMGFRPEFVIIPERSIDEIPRKYQRLWINPVPLCSEL